MTAPSDLTAVAMALSEHLAVEPVRASVSFLGLEEIQVLRFSPERDTGTGADRIYITLGMSRHPMTGAEEVVVNADGPRAELALHLRDPDDQFADVWRKLAVMAAAPAVEGLVYRPGVTVDLGEPLASGSRCSGVLVEASAIPAIATGQHSVAIFRVTPATASELAWCRVRGADALRELWEREGVDTLDLGRSGVALG